ncbi:MAG TPA: serine/threonine-protein kinase [Candidatus Hydrogenedentes bacterium]|nr:serine/threonine-protein kinase [Candidatus Hydrogenedentota bacterium]HOL75473.1 serine/threonine-protein kinase [Candidatus Hydrogenedentota bacterium]HPO86085.1 serine/threonine-protein kinase [Candidatus Hydrogenedentota bacterium]
MTNTELPKHLGRYEIVRELGKGAMGIVYEGVDPNIGRRVAIKTARRDVLQEESTANEMMERFLREARAAGVLNHPNIVTVYDADEENGIAYIAMEYICGSELRKLLQGGKRFSPEETVELVAALCQALDHAHAHGIVHRDIKPANIMVLEDGSIKVTDFGIARISGSNLTRDGSLIGTPYYMSPEQFMGHKVDGRADLFAAGVIAYELLTGEKPFGGETLGAVMHSVLKTEPIPPRELNFSIPVALEQVVLKALSKDPNRRYQTGKFMAAALKEALKENPDLRVLDIDVQSKTSATSDSAPTLVQATPDVQSTVTLVPPPKSQRSPAAGIETISSAHIHLQKMKQSRKVFVLLSVVVAIVFVMFLAWWAKQFGLKQTTTPPCWSAVEFEVFAHRFDNTGNEQVVPVETPTRVEIFGTTNGAEEKITEGMVGNGNFLISFPKGKWPRRFRYVAHNDGFQAVAEGESVGEPEHNGAVYLKMPVHFYLTE